VSACDLCLRRAWLLGRLAGHLDPVRARIDALMGLGDEELVAAVGGRQREVLIQRLAEFAPVQAREQAQAAAIRLICRCDPVYPARLRDLVSPPAVLHAAGAVERLIIPTDSQMVAIVGARRATAYGTGVARSLARGLASAGLTVVSGMASGIDSAAHEGAISAAGPTLAVLPGPADAPYPPSARGLYRRLLKDGAAVSEIPPGFPVRSWMFLARNRIIAALAAMTIVVEAGPASAALLTAGHATGLGHEVGAVPGRITTLEATGPIRLIRDGAHVISSVQDILDLLFEAGTRMASVDDRPELGDAHRAVLQAIEAGHDTPAALSRHGVVPGGPLAPLAWLELAGYVRRGAGGRFTVMA
jgi:DNA processing protein